MRPSFPLKNNLRVSVGSSEVGLGGQSWKTHLTFRFMETSSINYVPAGLGWEMEEESAQ